MKSGLPGWVPRQVSMRHSLLSGQAVAKPYPDQR